MRVIAGEARGRRLRPPPGATGRPTAERVREALFSILTARLPSPGWGGQRVLDLFAGSGALGIEALSRGAAQAVFVEVQASALRVVRTNLEHCGMAARARLVQDDVNVWLRRARVAPDAEGGPFDLVLADPPYASEPHRAVLESLAPPLLACSALVVLEHETGTVPPDTAGELGLVDRRRYGRATLSFYRPGAGGSRSPASAP